MGNTYGGETATCESFRRRGKSTRTQVHRIVGTPDHDSRGPGLLVAWFVVAIMEHTCLSRYVWHIPLLFLALIVLFSSLQCRCRSPPNHGKGAGQRGDCRHD